MNDEITPNPSVPTQVVAELKFPRFISNLGIIPTSYKDSMSYYECLAWFCKYLEETVIPTVNQNGSAVQELQNLYIELNDYVTHYFDNLDVQEMVNDKLDEMAEDGTLEEIMADYLNTKAVFGFDNVEDLTEAENLINGSFARTYGFYENGDGGGAFYRIRTVTNEDTINNIDLFALTNTVNLVAELCSDLNNVLCYGVTLDDSNSNNHTLINYVLNKTTNAYCDKNITLANTLEITTDYAKFNFNKITYSGNSYAIILNGLHINLTGKEIESNYDGLKIGKDTVTMWNNININKIKAEHDGIICGGSAGVYSDNITVNYVTYKNHGLFFDHSQYYTGELHFYNISFTDLSANTITEQYAIYGDFSSYRSTGMTFENISFEGTKGGMHLYTTGSMSPCEKLVVNGCRCAELSLRDDKKVLKLTVPNTGYITGEFKFDHAKPSSFDMSDFNATFGSGQFYLKGMFREAMTAPTDVIGTEAIITTQSLIITKLPLPEFGPSNSDIRLPRSFMVPVLGSGNTYNVKIETAYFRINGRFIFMNPNSSSKTINILNKNDGTIRAIPIGGNSACIVDIGNNLANKTGNIINIPVSSCNYWDIPAN